MTKRKKLSGPAVLKDIPIPLPLPRGYEQEPLAGFAPTAIVRRNGAEVGVVTADGRGGYVGARGSLYVSLRPLCDVLARLEGGVA